MFALGCSHLHKNATPVTSSHPPPTAPSSLLHHFQLGVPWSCLVGVSAGDIFMTPPGLQILVQWTKTHQSVHRAPVLPILEVPECPADLVAAYHLLLAASPTTSADQSPSIVYTEGRQRQLAGRAWIRSTSNGRDCGQPTPSSNTSHHHIVPPHQ